MNPFNFSSNQFALCVNGSQFINSDVKETMFVNDNNNKPWTSVKSDTIDVVSSITLTILNLVEIINKPLSIAITSNKITILLTVSKIDANTASVLPIPSNSLNKDTRIVLVSIIPSNSIISIKILSI